MNTVNDERYRYNNLQHPVITWYHAFSPDGWLRNWHTDGETYFMWQRMTPNLNNLKSAPLLFNNSNAAFCNPKVVTRTSQEYGIVNCVRYQFRPNAFLTFRNEYYNDFSGQRTGFKTQYSEHFIGMAWWIGDVITIRPGIRLDASYNRLAFDNGLRYGQFTGECDIFHY